tara:strand:+ start:123 stop:302 length:180 start_codon:yes stop_codon:yes gene_type:complete
MTFEQVKQNYLAENSEFALATEVQVDKLSDWLDKNDYHNAAHMRWEMDQEELRYLMYEI